MVSLPPPLPQGPPTNSDVTGKIVGQEGNIPAPVTTGLSAPQTDSRLFQESRPPMAQTASKVAATVSDSIKSPGLPEARAALYKEVTTDLKNISSKLSHVSGANGKGAEVLQLVEYHQNAIVQASQGGRDVKMSENYRNNLKADIRAVQDNLLPEARQTFEGNQRVAITDHTAFQDSKLLFQALSELNTTLNKIHMDDDSFPKLTQLAKLPTLPTAPPPNSIR